MSDERFRKQMYLIRLLHETFRCDKFDFKMKYKAVVQTSESQNEQTAKVKTLKLIII